MSAFVFYEISLHSEIAKIPRNFISDQTFTLLGLNQEFIQTKLPLSVLIHLIHFLPIATPGCDAIYIIKGTRAHARIYTGALFLYNCFLEP